MFRPVLAVFLLIMICFSCYYDSEEYLFPQIGCDSLNVTYSGSVAPIISDFCVSCHSIGNPIKLDNYVSLKVLVDNGALLGAINHEDGFQPMPQGGAKLDDCRLTIISKWVNEGAPNN